MVDVGLANRLMDSYLHITKKTEALPPHRKMEQRQGEGVIKEIYFLLEILVQV